MMLLLVLAANAADPVTLPSTCGDAGTALCVDVDLDGSFANAKEAAAKDCNDDNARVHPGARLVLGDGEDNDCDGTTDDTEYAQAVEAARAAAAKRADPQNPDSPKATAAAELAVERFEDELDRCLEGQGFVNEDSTGVWGWENPSSKVPTCFAMADGLTYRRGGVGYQTPADRAALGAAAAAGKKADTAMGILVGPDGHGGLVAEVDGLQATVYGLDTDQDGKVDVPGLKIDVATLWGATYGLDTTGDGIVDVVGTLARLDAVEASLGNVRLWAFGADNGADGRGGIDGDVRALRRDVDSLMGSGPVFTLAVGGSVFSGREMREYDGTLIRGAAGGGADLTATVGHGWAGPRFGNQLFLDMGIGMGGRESSGGTLAFTAFHGGAGYQLVFPHAAIGPEFLIVGGAQGNLLSPTTSFWGLGGGLKGNLFFSPDGSESQFGLYALVGIVAESYGTEIVPNVGELYDHGASGVFSVGAVFGRGPTRE